MVSSAPAAERLLHTAHDRAGQHPADWAAAPLAGADRVLEVAGTALAVGPPTALIGLHAATTALPLRTKTIDGAALLLALPDMAEVDLFFAELRRVLRPGATVVVTVPTTSLRTPAELRMSGLLGSVHRGWRNRSALDRAGWLLAAADFAVLGDDRRSFTLPLPDAAAAHELAVQLPRAGLWPPEIAADVPERLAARAGAGRVLPVPLRRLVARR